MDINYLSHIIFLYSSQFKRRQRRNFNFYTHTITLKRDIDLDILSILLQKCKSCWNTLFFTCVYNFQCYKKIYI